MATPGGGAGDTSRTRGPKVVVCVGGGIAAYKVVEVARALTRLGADVRVAMTPGARRFVGPQTFAGVTGNPVAVELFGTGEAPHVELARGASAAVVAPATANLIARAAAGMADDVVAATLLMVRCPVVIAPAMHSEMWDHPATRRNVATLVERGAVVVGPGEGALMSGDVGVGRMVEPADIVEAVVAALGRAHDLAGRKVVVTAGGTQEPIDPVRFLGNRSSGLMGYLVAEAARARGADVTLVSGPTQLDPPHGVALLRVQTADEMRAAVLDAAADADAIVKAAAVADFKPDRASGVKLKKALGPPAITLVPTPDILAELGTTRDQRPPGSVIVGFAAETEPDPAKLARLGAAKRAAKGADVIVANDVSSPDSGFSVPTNRAVIVGPRGVTDAGLVTKTELARALVDEIVALLRANGRKNPVERDGADD